ncbi:MAG: sensor histidine kinase [Planctomycetota bacterium]|jgi:signal transduction histidine kinase
MSADPEPSSEDAEASHAAVVVRRSRLRRLRGLKGPVILFVIALVLAVALLVLWNVVLAIDYRRITELAAQAAKQEGAAFHTTFISVGSALFAATIALFSILGAILIQEILFSRRLSGFIATFTHELNSPLASIKLFAQTLRGQEDLGLEQRRRFLDLMLHDVERLHTQISNVLRAGEVDSPLGISVRPERVDLIEYLREYVDARQPRLQCLDTPGTLEFDASDDVALEARLDRAAFRQALDNVIDNSVKYTAQGEAPWIRISASAAKPGRVAIEVTDRGVGIERKELGDVFDRFQRSQAARGSRRGGTGLGLWIVQALIEAHEGDVAALSAGHGRGTTIRFEVPGQPGSSDPEDAADAADASASEAPEVAL